MQKYSKKSTDVFSQAVDNLILKIIIPTLGSEGPQWGPVKLICPSVSLSVRMSLCISCLSVSLVSLIL